jgi:hypothetical protein
MELIRKEILTVEEFAFLSEVSKSWAPRVVPLEARGHLISVGYIQQAQGCLILTEAGKMRLAHGR